MLKGFLCLVIWKCEMGGRGVFINVIILMYLHTLIVLVIVSSNKCTTRIQYKCVMQTLTIKKAEDNQSMSLLMP